MSNEREFDVVIFGATGFTGKLVAEYFQAQYGSDDNVKWAVAGRNEAKLNGVKKELGISESVASIVADGDDDDALNALTKRTAVVLTTVGPYQIYGEKLLSACVDNGTGYTDLCGEPAWMHQMINKYEAKAKETGANIVFSCGFDSVPFDLGVYYLQEHAKKQTGDVIEYVKGRVRKMQGTFSGGTAASLKATMAAAHKDKSVMAALINPHSLTDGASNQPQPDGNKPYFDEQLGTWVAPFIMAAINTKNVHRTNYLGGYSYGKNFQYDEMMMTGPGEKGEAMANHVAKDRPRQETKLARAGRFIFLNDLRARDVARHQVGRELNAAELECQRVGKRANHQRFRQTWYTDQQAMPSGKQGNQQLFDDRLLAHDDLAQFAGNLRIGLAELSYALDIFVL